MSVLKPRIDKVIKYEWNSFVCLVILHKRLEEMKNKITILGWGGGLFGIWNNCHSLSERNLQLSLLAVFCSSNRQCSVCFKRFCHAGTLRVEKLNMFICLCTLLSRKIVVGLIRINFWIFHVSVCPLSRLLAIITNRTQKYEWQPTNFTVSK